MVESVRRGIGDYSDELVQGTEEGGFSNEQIVEKVNNAQRYIYAMILKRAPETFLESEDITGVSSVYALPSDFGRLVQFRDEDGRQVHSLKAKQLKLNAATGNDSFYYRKGTDLILDKDNVNKKYTLWYYRYPRDLDYGKATGGAANSITLASTASNTVNYYTGMSIKDVTQDWEYEITAYTTGRVATVSGTAVENDYYGISSDLPNPFHFLIPLKAIIEMKATSPISLEKPTKEEILFFQDQLLNTLNCFSPLVDDDEDVESLWTDYGSPGYYGGIVYE